MGRLPLTWLVIAASAMGLPGIVRADPAACDVSVVSAPADVRDAIVAWIHGERSCTTLEVRATATDQGYQLRARRIDGRVFERSVPDARTAGAVVASWATDMTAIDATPAPADISVELSWTPPAAPKPDIDVELHWTPPAAPKPDIDVELHWTPPAAPKPDIDVELQWTPPSRSKPRIDVELQWTPPAPQVPPRSTIDVERAIGLMPR